MHNNKNNRDMNERVEVEPFSLALLVWPGLAQTTKAQLLSQFMLCIFSYMLMAMLCYLHIKHLLVCLRATALSSAKIKLKKEKRLLAFFALSLLTALSSPFWTEFLTIDYSKKWAKSFTFFPFSFPNLIWKLCKFNLLCAKITW